MSNSEVIEMAPIPGVTGYLASPSGRIWSAKRAGRWLRPSVGAKGYYHVTPYVAGRGVTREVHVLVAASFLGPRPDGAEVRHLNGDPLDNRIENLAYGTPSENEYDKVRHGTHNSSKKTHCPKGHPYSGENLQVTGRGWRKCRACVSAWNRGQRERRGR